MRGVNCPHCGAAGSKCLMTYYGAERSSVRRRRRCYECHKTFHTEEKVVPSKRAPRVAKPVSTITEQADVGLAEILTNNPMFFRL